MRQHVSIKHLMALWKRISFKICDINLANTCSFTVLCPILKRPKRFPHTLMFGIKRNVKISRHIKAPEASFYENAWKYENVFGAEVDIGLAHKWLGKGIKQFAVSAHIFRKREGFLYHQVMSIDI